MRSLDPAAVYQKALAHPAGVDDLDELELLVYCVQEIENYEAMQGWDGFFSGSCSYLYPTLRRCLELIGDTDSLAIIDDYIHHLTVRGVPFEPDAIDEFIRGQSDADHSSRPAWGSMFRAATAQRWQRLETYLRTRGVELSQVRA